MKQNTNNIYISNMKKIVFEEFNIRHLNLLIDLKVKN